jgi:hypothetical protein
VKTGDIHTAHLFQTFNDEARELLGRQKRMDYENVRGVKQHYEFVCLTTPKDTAIHLRVDVLDLALRASVELNNVQLQGFGVIDSQASVKEDTAEAAFLAAMCWDSRRILGNVERHLTERELKESAVRSLRDRAEEQLKTLERYEVLLDGALKDVRAAIDEYKALSGEAALRIEGAQE